MPTLSDREAVQRVKNGEIEFYSHIVKAYTKIILAYVNRVLYDKGEVEDLVQNTFIQFYKNINHFDESRPVLPYLYQIAKNEIKMYLRSRKSTLSLDERIKVEETVDTWETQTEAQELLASLSPEQKKALELVYEGYSYQEIANTLKKPINTVRTIIRRARLTLIKKR